MQSFFSFRQYLVGMKIPYRPFFSLLFAFLFFVVAGKSQSFPGDCQAGLSPCSYNYSAGQTISDIPFNYTSEVDLIFLDNSVNFYVDSGQVYLFSLNQKGNYINPKLSLFRLPEFQQPELICSNTSEIRWLADYTGFVSLQVNESDFNCTVRFQQDFDPRLSFSYRKFSNPLVNCNTGNQAQLTYACGTNALGQGFFQFYLQTQDLVSDPGFIPDTMEIFFKRSDQAETVSSWTSGIKSNGIAAGYDISGQTFYNRSFESGRILGNINNSNYDLRYRFICNGEAGPMSEISSSLITCSPCLNSVGIQSVDVAACSSILIKSQVVSGSGGLAVPDFFRVYYKKLNEPENTPSWTSSIDYYPYLSGNFPDFFWNVRIPALEPGGSYMVKWQPGCNGGFTGAMSPVSFFSENICKINIAEVDASPCQLINLKSADLPVQEQVDSVLVCYRKVNEPENVSSWLTGKKYVNLSPSFPYCRVSIPNLQEGQNYFLKIRPVFQGFTPEFSDVFQFLEDSCRLLLNCPDVAYTGAGANLSWDGPPNVLYNLDYSEKKTGPWNFVAGNIPVTNYVQVPIPKHSSKKIQSTLYNRVSLSGNPSQYSIDSMLVTNTTLTFLNASKNYLDPAQLDLDLIAGKVQKIWTESLPAEIYLNSRGAFTEGFPGEGSITIEGRITTSQGSSVVLSDPEPFSTGIPVGYSNYFFVDSPVIKFFGSTISGPTDGIGQVIDRDTLTVFLKNKVIQSPVAVDVLACPSTGNFQMAYFGASPSDEYKFSSNGGQTWTPINRQGAIVPDPFEPGLSSVSFAAPAVNSPRCRIMVTGGDTTSYNFSIINARPLLTAVGGNTTFCESGRLQAEGVGKFLWYKNGVLQSGENSSFLDVTASGLYTVKTVFEACTSVVSTGINISVLSPPQASVISAQGNTSFCQGGSVTIIGNTGGTWSNGQTTPTISVTQAGIYSVSTTNSCGTVSSNSITVTVNPLPVASVISAQGNTTFCQGGSVVLSTNATGSHKWSTGSTSASITITSSSTVRDTAILGTCKVVSNPVVVTVNPNPTKPVISGGPLTFCQGGSVVLSTNATGSHKWSTGSTSASITVTSSSTVRDTAILGTCKVVSNPVVVTVNPNPTKPVISGGPLTFCQGGSVVLSTNATGSHKWSTGSTSASITITSSSTVRDTAILGTCKVVSNPVVVTVNALPTVDAGLDVAVVQNSGNTTLTGIPSGGTWSGTGVSTGGVFSSSGSIGQYKLNYCVTNAQNCTKCDSLTATINSGVPLQVATPAISPGANTYSGPQLVTVSCATPGAQIYYTTTGNTPVVGTTFTKLYSAPFQIISTTNVKAIGVLAGSNNSAVASTILTILNPGIVSAPVITPGTGTVTGPVAVSISCATTNASIYYTTSGNTPVVGTTFTRLYSGPFTIIGTSTIKAMAVQSGLSNSSVVVANITMLESGIVKNPVISPGSGSFDGSVLVSISTSTPDAQIYFTTTGNTPVIGTGFTRLYTGPFTLLGTTTVRAMAVKSGLANSGVAVANLVVNTSSVVAAPTFSPAPGTYPSRILVSISSATVGAQIYVTNNGITPSNTSLAARLYSTPLNVGSSGPIKAIAYKAGLITSPVSVGSYVIGAARVSTEGEGEEPFYYLQTEPDDLQADPDVDVIPNPSNGRFRITTSQAMKDAHIHIYNMLGQLVSKSDTIHDQLSVDVDISQQPTGFYTVVLMDGNARKVIRVTKD